MTSAEPQGVTACDCNTVPCVHSEAVPPARWREGHHWQAEIGSVAAWFGIAHDRWMVGVIFNHDGRNLGFGIGPLYFGTGAAYDR